MAVNTNVLSSFGCSKMHVTPENVEKCSTLGFDVVLLLLHVTDVLQTLLWTIFRFVKRAFINVEKNKQRLQSGRPFSP